MSVFQQMAWGGPQPYWPSDQPMQRLFRTDRPFLSGVLKSVTTFGDLNQMGRVKCSVAQQRHGSETDMWV